MELEAKAFGVDAPNNLEVKKAFEDFLAGFDAFKQDNDARLKGQWRQVSRPAGKSLRTFTASARQKSKQPRAV